jgi:hypothetical protein
MVQSKKQVLGIGLLFPKQVSADIDGIPGERLPLLKAKLTALGFQSEAKLDSFVLFANAGEGWKQLNVFQLTGDAD